MGGGISKGIQVVVAIFGIIKKVLIVGAIAGIWTFMYQHYYQLIDNFHDEKDDLLTKLGVSKLLQEAPRFGLEFWIIGILLLIMIIVQIGKFNRRMLVPEVSSQNNGK
jgi:hypothetical protein